MNFTRKESPFCSEIAISTKRTTIVCPKFPLIKVEQQYINLNQCLTSRQTITTVILADLPMLQRYVKVNVEAKIVQVKQPMVVGQDMKKQIQKVIIADKTNYATIHEHPRGGLGAVLLKQHNEWKPVAFASRSMTDTEKRYSQIEKEALALVWACKKFSDYVIGKSIQLETDHKPLVPLLGYTNLGCLPPRVLRFWIRLMRFDYSISHVPGKLLYTADTLSRAPVNPPDVNHIHEDTQTELFVHALASNLPASTDRLKAFRDAQQKDSTCSQLITFCKQGWPSKSQITGDLSQYWRVRGELSLHDVLLL